MSDFQIKDSGNRQEFDSGMVRDTADDKVDYSSLAFGPMMYRWAMHCTKGRIKYPDPKPGVPNWTLAKGMAEYLRFKASAFRHFMAWFWGLRDEDHAAGVFFNINGAEYVRENLWADATGIKANTGQPPLAPINQPPSPEEWARARAELSDQAQRPDTAADEVGKVRIDAVQPAGKDDLARSAGEVNGLDP